jgi:hypothetical protein
MAVVMQSEPTQAPAVNYKYEDEEDGQDGWAYCPLNKFSISRGKAEALSGNRRHWI